MRMDREWSENGCEYDENVMRIVLEWSETGLRMWLKWCGTVVRMG